MTGPTVPAQTEGRALSGGPGTPVGPPESGDSYDAESSLLEETVAVPGERNPAGAGHGDDPGAHAGEGRPLEDGGTAAKA